MGVQGLESFAHSFFPSSCCYEVSIEQLVREFHKKKGCKRKPKIVIHFSNTMITLIQKGTDWVYGGQSKEILDKIGALITAFQRIGVQPVFFFRGYFDIDTEDFERNDWIKKSLAELRRMPEFFSCLEEKVLIPRCDPRFINASFEDLSYYISAIYGCEVHKATTESNTEVVLYARNTKDCIAIFAQDSMFIIYETGKYYLSAKYFNIETMTTRVYSREGFAQKVGLDPWQLPLFATLADCTSTWEIPGFFKKFCDAKTYERFSPTARYVKQLCYDKEAPLEEAIFKILPFVAEEVFSKKKTATFEEFLAEEVIGMGYKVTVEEFLAYRIHQYLCTKGPVNLSSEDPTWNAILKKAEELHRTNRNPTIIGKVLNNQPFYFFLGLEDLRDNMLSTICITQPLRQKLYGILLKEKPPNPEPYFVTEKYVESPNKPIEPFQVEPLPPEGNHPGLLVLWGDDRSKKTQKIRWRLFAHAVSHNLDPNHLRNLPVHLILPTATIFYLWEYEVQQEQTKNKLLKDWEVDALIATAVILPTVSNETPGPPYDGMDSRPVHVATIFNRTLISIMDVHALCGYPLPFEKTYAQPYFSGRLFQEKFNNAKKKQSLFEHEDEVLLEQFHRISKIVFKKA